MKHILNNCQYKTTWKHSDVLVKLSLKNFLNTNDQSYILNIKVYSKNALIKQKPQEKENISLKVQLSSAPSQESMVRFSKS